MNKQTNRSPYKPRWSMLPPESIKLGEAYSFSLNLKDECDTLKDAYNYYLYIISLLIKPYCEFQLNFELSCIGRLHCHGEVIFHDYKDLGMFYFKFGKLRNRFACEMDTIEDAIKWKVYCTKQEQIMSSGLLPNLGVICNKDMLEKQYISPKIREQVEDHLFEENHLDD